MSNASAGLELTSLTCERGDRVLFSHFSQQIEGGRGLRIAGPNGSGKTTLLRVVAGLSQHYEGSVRWQDQDVRDQQYQFRSQLLFLGHAPGVKSALTPQENLHWWTAMHGIGIGTQAGVQEAILDALARVGLSAFVHTPCSQLSAGQQRRVALARLFLSQHPLWILDEPFTAIDSQGVASLEQLFEQQLDHGGIILLTTHQDLNSERFTTIQLDQPAVTERQCE